MLGRAQSCSNFVLKCMTTPTSHFWVRSSVAQKQHLAVQVSEALTSVTSVALLII